MVNTDKVLDNRVHAAQRRFFSRHRESKVESHSGVKFHHPAGARQYQRHLTENTTTSTTNGNNNQQPSTTTPQREGRVIPSRVFVGNIPANLVERDLGMLFARFGKIRDVKIIPDQARSKSYGFVTFFSESDARRAIQASLQHDAIMWGDRRLNVAPAIKRNNNNSPTRLPSTESLLAALPRISGTTYFTNPLHVSTPALFQTAGIGGETTAGTELSQPTALDATNNGLYHPTAVICRLPHQFAMPQCQWNSTAAAAAASLPYYVTPTYQPYIASGNQMTHYATSYPAAYGGQDTCRPALSIAPLQHGISMPSLTSPRDHNSSGSSTTSSSSSSTITDGMSDVEGGDAGRVVSGSQEKSGGQELAVQEETGQHDLTATMNGAYPLHHTTMICCAHHSCMMNPVSHPMVQPHLTNQALAGSRSPCLSIHPPTPPVTPTCYAPPNSPLIAYASPLPAVYGNPSLRRTAARLQRWNSLDGGIQQQQQAQVSLWGNEAWTQQHHQVINDPYGSDNGLHYSTARPASSLRAPFSSCQSHGLVSPFCRSFDFSVWGQQQQPQPQYHLVTESTDQLNLSASTPNLNLNETATEQPSNNSKK